MASIMMILDGMQDIHYPRLEGKTPYDCGKGEHFTALEGASARARLRTTPKGFEPDTQACILTMLGVKPEDIPTGRSCIEALAVGMPVEEDDMVLRCNYVKISGDGMLEVPCCTPPEEVAVALRKELDQLPGNHLKRVGGYKSLQRIQHARRYIDGMVTWPPHNYGGQSFEEHLPSGNELAEWLAAFSRAMLEKYRPYTVFNWAQSVTSKLPLFADLHGGLTGAMISATHAPMGGAIAMGMACPELPTATGDVDTDLALKARETLAHLNTHDVVILHVGGPDEATHRQDEVEKARFIAKMDRELIGPILEGAPAGTRIMVTCDHEAYCSTAGHTDLPVECLLYQKGGVHSGDLGEIDGIETVELLCRGNW